MARKATVKDVRRANRALVVRHLLLEGTSSRAAAGEATGLSAATVTSVIGDLIDEGAVVEQGQVESDGGRPRTVLGLNRDAARVIGADVGETDVTIGLFDLDMNRLGERRYPFRGRRISPEQVMDTIVAGVGELLDDRRGSAVPILGLGLGVPGIVRSVQNADGTTDSLVHAQVIGWDGVSFGELSHRLGLPVFIDNGAKTTTQAESWFGSIKGVDDAVVVLIGAGAGAGIISNGALLRGSSSSAGEWGHTKISMDGVRCRCGAKGCVETFVGAVSILEAWLGPEAHIDGQEDEAIAALFAARSDGDERARTAVADLVDHLGVALSNLVNLYNPRMLILGGWFGDIIAEHVLDEVIEVVQRSSLEQPAADVRIERSTLGSKAVALGAATLPIEQFVESGFNR
jgi:predicted NBD/HSP70 family sugar kinase